jgi:hypothetical protein
MARHPGRRESRKLGKGDLDRRLHHIRQPPQSRPQHQKHPGDLREVPAQGRRRGLHPLLLLHGIDPGALPLRATHQTIIPATVAVMKAAMEPPIMALSPSLARSCFRFGAIPPIPPIWMAMEEKLAKPERA